MERNVAKKYKKWIQVVDVPFEEKFLNLDCYLENKEKKWNQTKLGGHYCYLAREAWDRGDFRGFCVKSFQPKGNIPFHQVQQYIQRLHNISPDSVAERAVITFVYRAIIEHEIVYFACNTEILLPVLYRFVDSFEEDNKRIFLKPMIASVYGGVDKDFRTLLKFSYSNLGGFPFEYDVDTRLLEYAWLAIVSNQLEEKRCFMKLDTGNSFAGFSVNIEDIKSKNIEGMYGYRPFLKE